MCARAPGGIDDERLTKEPPAPTTEKRKTGGSELVRRRSLDVVDHEDVNPLLRGIQLEPKLFQ